MDQRAIVRELASRQRHRGRRERGEAAAVRRAVGGERALVEGCDGGRVEQQRATLPAPALAAVAASERRVGVQRGGCRHQAALMHRNAAAAAARRVAAAHLARIEQRRTAYQVQPAALRGDVGLEHALHNDELRFRRGETAAAAARASVGEERGALQPHPRPARWQPMHGHRTARAAGLVLP